MQTPVDDPQQFPFALDVATARVLVVELTARQRAQAAFLDQRALADGARGVWHPLAQAVDRAHALPRGRLDFIFHMGHCGSTLLSRVLQSWPELQVLREPLPLRTLAELRYAHVPDAVQRERIAEALLRLWARPIAAHGRTLIKATSSCNGLADELLAADECRHALLLRVSLERYLATILKAPGSVRDAIAAAPERAEDLHRRSEGAVAPPDSADTPAICAMGWLAERLRFDALAAASGGRALQVDFDDLLQDRASGIARIAGFLGLSLSRTDAALASPAWQRYAKDTAHDYDGEDRAHDLQLASERHADDIAHGIRWVESQRAHVPSRQVDWPA